MISIEFLWMVRSFLLFIYSKQQNPPRWVFFFFIHINKYLFAPIFAHLSALKKEDLTAWWKAMACAKRCTEFSYDFWLCVLLCLYVACEIFCCLFCFRPILKLIIFITWIFQVFLFQTKFRFFLNKLIIISSK